MYDIFKEELAVKDEKRVGTGIVWTIYTLAMAFAVYGFLALQVQIYRESGQYYCMLDCMHKLAAPWDFGLFYLPVTSGYILMNRKAYQYAGFVIRYHRIEEAWKAAFRERAVRSGLCSGIYSIISCLFSWLSTYEVTNWETENSIFGQVNGGIYEGSPAVVILAFFIFNFIKTFLAVLFLVLLEIWCKGLIQGYLVLGTIMVVEWCSEDVGIFLNLFCIKYGNFRFPWTVWLLIGGGSLLILGAYLTGRNVWKDKEFYE